MTSPDSTIGVDIGGTKVSVARVARGKIAVQEQQATRKGSAEELIAQICTLVGHLRGDLPIKAVGVGVPSLVEFSTGTVRASVNIPLQGVALRKILSDEIGLPVFVDNDATVAAFAEAHDEQGRLVTSHLVMVTVGTGVGGGLVLGGRVYRGATGAAAELGHTLIGLAMGDHVPAPTGFPQPGSLETLAAGRELDRLAAACAARAPQSALGRLAAAGHGVLGPDCVAAAHDGDADAIATVRLLGERLGVGIANAINIFDPEVVAIGGGVSRAGDLLLEPARRVALGYVVPGSGEQTVIRLAHHGVAAGVLGAALMAGEELDHQEGKR